MLYLCAMHVNVQTRYNSAIGKEAPYFRFKESYRDVRGNVHSLIVLNIGFEPEMKPIQIKRISAALTNVSLDFLLVMDVNVIYNFFLLLIVLLVRCALCLI